MAGSTKGAFGLRLLSLAALLAVPAVAWATLTGSSFEGSDGDLVPQSGIDWQSFVGSPRLKVGVDLPVGQNDDSLAGKEDDVVPGIDTGSIPSNKSDLLRFYTYHERVESGGTARDFLYLAWVRLDTLGTANMDFEFNQSSTLTANGTTVVRTPGDMLITYGFTGGGNPTLGLSRWTATGPCASSPSAPCWGPVMPLTGVAEGSVNAVAVNDPVSGGTLPALTFGEAAIDLTAANVFPSDACVSFGRGFVKSRSSNSFSSSLKDFIKPIDVKVSNCGTVTIHKNALPDSDQDFAFTMSSNLGTSAFALDDDGNNGNALPNTRTFQGRFSGTIDVTEEPTAGWDLTDVTCTVGGNPDPSVDGLPSPHVTIENLQPGESVDCTYTNTARGRIRVFQAVLPAGDPQSFDFLLAGGPNGVNDAFALQGGSTPHDSGSVRAGTYSIAQTDPGLAWDLQSATCDDGSPVGAVQVGPGETVNCTFVNVKRGEILIDETTVPAGASQAFPFALTGGPDATNQTFNLAHDDTPHASGLIRPGTFAAVQSPVPAGWDLTSAVCSDGSSPGAIALSPGEVVTCTFTHTQRGQIVIDEVTIPSGDSQSFAFSLTGGPNAMNAPFSLTDAAAPFQSSSAKPGTYAATQSPLPAGFDLVSAVCDDGSSPSSINLSAGEVVTCTFTHAKRGRIVVDEVTIPSGDGQSFAFAVTGGPDALNASFSLTDAAAPYQSTLAKAGTYAATQSPLPNGWDLVSAVCDDGSSPSAINLASGETVTCTFTHAKRGTILVDVTTTPSADPQAFGFTLTGGPDATNQSFSLADASAPHSSGLVRAGTVAATAAATPAGWDLVSSSCSDGSAVGSIGLSAGETVTCTFNYVKRGKIVIDEVTQPSGDSQSFPFSLSGGPDSINASFSLADAAAPYQSATLKPGTYASAQSPIPSGWDLVSATCSDGSPVSAIVVSAGETVTCTFTHAKRATIRVDVVTTPSGDPQTFGFSLTGGPDAINQSFSLADASAVHSSGLVRAGTYAATAAATPAGWDLVSSSCNDGSAVGSIGLSSGETVTCTFNYVKRGRIIIDEVTQPSGDPQSFPFVLTGGPDALNASFSLTDTATPYQSVALRPGTYASSQNPFPAGWDFVSAVCDDGSSYATIVLSAGETVTCTFTHAKRGTILVDVVTTPAADPQLFGFTLTGGPSAINQSFSLRDTTAPYSSGLVRQGTYAATAGATPAGFDLVSSSCSDGSAVGSIGLAAGETVTCTFNYVKRGRILVDVKTTPAGSSQSFGFGLTGGPDSINQSFSLTDTAALHDSGAVKPGTYDVDPAATPSGWDLVSSSCSDGSAVGSVGLAPGETVTCTFNYVQRGQVLVDVTTLPAGSTQAFAFTFSGGPDAVSQSFSLTDAAAPRNSGPVRPGTYAAVAGATPAGWDFISSSCSDGSAPGSIGLSAGETVTCTFSYVQRGKIIIDEVTTPSGDPQSFPFTLTGGPDSLNASFSLTDTAAPYQSVSLRAGNYSASQSPFPTGWDFASATCSDGSSHSTIVLSPGEVITCTFRHTKRGAITIIKDARPNHEQNFSFAIVGPNVNTGFPLDDDADPTLSNTRTATALPLGAYTVSEADPGSMWDNTGLSCTSSIGSMSATISLPSRSASFTLRPGETVTCTFVNSMRGRITVIKMMEDTTPGPTVDPTQIPFDFTGWDTTFTLKHLESETSPWLKTDRSYTITELPYLTWKASSVCVFPDGSRTTGGASISVTPPPADTVVCTFTNAPPQIHAGSSGFWKNWSNHYTIAQFRSILSELRGSPVYATLFDASGNLRSDAVATIDAIYTSGGDTDQKRLLKEFTSTMLNLIVSTSSNPAVRALQNNDDITRDTKLRLSASVEEFIRSFAPCDIAAGVRIGDVIDIVEAMWNGDVTGRIYSFGPLTSSQMGILAGICEGIGQGSNVVVDPDLSPRPHGLAIGGTFATTWFLDGDGDGFGGAPVTTCDETPQDGYSANDDDCDDTRAAVYPGAPEVCDGRRNDCNAAGWPALGGLETDNDHDGYAECSGDCNDSNVNVYPGQAEACNALDDDCNGLVDDDGIASDADGDGVRAICDNCPSAANTGQGDADHDGIGDACDVCAATADLAQLDTDNDGVGDACDNCRSASNQFQDDADVDGLGDVCDNCVDKANAAQSDLDHDGEGDLCDVNDGVIYLVPSATGGDYLEWQNEFGFTTWNVYKGSLAVLKSTGAYTQAPGSNPLAAKVCGTASNSYPDAAAQAANTAAFYLVTGKVGGVEGSLGTRSSGVARTNTTPCP